MFHRTKPIFLVLLYVVGWSSVAYGQGATGVDDHPHLLHIEVKDPDPDALYPGGPDHNAVIEGEDPEEEAERVPAASFDLSGWVWFNYAFQEWRESDVDKFANFTFNQVQLTGTARWGSFSSRFEIRFFSDFLLLRQAWISYEWDDNQLRLGHVIVPWGKHQFSSNSWWFTLGWYSTVEDDYDYGLLYTRDTENYRLDIGYYVQDNLGLLGRVNRWDSDLTPQGEQQNREVSSFATRFVYKLNHAENFKSEIGAMGQFGLLHNTFNDEIGYRWQGGLMYNGDYNGWRPTIQLTRNEFRPENPDQIDGVAVDDRLVRISQFGGFRDIAAKFTLMNFIMAKSIPFETKYLQALVPYFEYSMFLKDEDLPDSHLLTAGLQVHLGSVWIWMDFLTGQNATYLNDSFANSALGVGANRPDRWEHQTNIQFQYYF